MANKGEPQEVPGGSEDTTNDYLLSMNLQRFYDLEYDAELKARESKINANQKVCISYENYLLVPSDTDDSCDDEDEYEAALREQATSKIYNRSPPNFGPSGLLKQKDGSYVSKHDKTVCGKKNADKIFKFPPEFSTGDAGGDDIKLPNHVYNELRSHSKTEQKRNRKFKEKNEKAMAEFALDAKTRLILFKLVNSGLLESVTGSVSTGKEANVLHAYGCGQTFENKEVPTECAIKVYRATFKEFKNRWDYVREDYRYKNPRKIIKIWAEKELLNLRRIHRAGIRCPKPVILRNNVLVMSFIGNDSFPAPKLKEQKLDGAELELAYGECIEIARKLYTDCHLVHGDLSEFNILYWHNHCWVIDVAQAIDISHPKAMIFLARDCQNLTEFFQKRVCELPNDEHFAVMAAVELFNWATGLEIVVEDSGSREEFFTEVEKFAAENLHLQRTQDKKNPADCFIRSGDSEGAAANCETDFN